MYLFFYKSFMKNFTKRFKGFTLVEVLIVIIIVGILIAALLPRLTGSQARARNTARTAAVNQVANSMALLIADGSPLYNSGQAIGSPSCATLTTSGTAGDVLSDYLASIPQDPNDTQHGGCAVDTRPYYSEDGTQAFIFAELESVTAGADGNSTGLLTNTEAGYNTALATAGDNFSVFVRG